LNERRPDEPEVQRLTVRCLRALGRTAEARARLDRLLERSPDDAELIFERGALALDAGQPQEAEPWLRRACDRRPSEREWLFRFAQCLEQVGKPAEAGQVRERLVRCERDLARARELVKQIAAAPRDAALRWEVGVLFLRNGYPDEGRRWLE